MSEEAEVPEPAFIDAGRDAEFAERGFTVLPLFEPAEVEAIRDELAELASGVAAANHGPIYLSFFERDEARRSRLEKAVAKRIDPALAKWLRGGRSQHHGVVAKAPGAERLPIHHHAAVTDCFFRRELICWCPLTDVDEESGAMRFVPRSHNILPYVRLPRGADYFASFAAEVEHHAVTLPLKAGEAVVFDNSILHGSCPNRQDRTRLAISCQVVPAAARNGLTLEGPPGFIDFIEAPSAKALEAFVQTGVRSDDWQCTRRIPNRNRAVSEAEFVALLSSPVKASESIDPLDAVRRPSPVHAGLLGRAGALARKMIGRA